jgi:subtilisin family serine protease
MNEPPKLFAGLLVRCGLIPFTATVVASASRWPIMFELKPAAGRRTAPIGCFPSIVHSLLRPSCLRRDVTKRGCPSTAVIGLLVVVILFHTSVLTAGVIGHAPDRVLLKLKAEVPENEAERLFSSQGAIQTQTIPHIWVRVLKVPPSTLSKVLDALSHDPRVEFAEPDSIFEPDLIPDDPYFSSQWHLATIGAPAAWDTTAGSSSVIVAILDTGVDGTHPDLVPNLVPGWNTYDNNSNTADVAGHGTAVAGTAAAAGNNGIGVASVAFNCSIMPIRVSDLSGSGYASTIARGLTWAADHGARVANISYEVTGIETVSSAAQYFDSKGGVVTVSAGNYSTALTIPDDPNVLTVSATDSNDALASWSNTGTPIDLAAPGVGIYTTTMGGGYGSVSGTSFSAPTVAGVAALVISANPSLSSSQVQQVLKQSADDLGAPGWDPVYGWGRVNAQKAVCLAATFGQGPGGTNQIWGRVLWAGQPVSGAVVSTPNGTNVAQATTSSDGCYVLRNLAPSTAYTVSCSETGLTFTPQFTNPLPLGFGNAYGADFYANQPAFIPYTVSGQVTDPVNGAAGAEVRGGGMVTTTDASGNYQFTNFLNGWYTLVARKDWWTFSRVSWTMKVSSSNSSGNNFARVAPYSISGCIYGVPATATSPAPLIYLSNGSFVPAARSGSGQSYYWAYTLSNVPAGQYSLSAELAGYSIIPQAFASPLAVNTNLASMNFTGSVATVAGSLSGRVTQQGLPIPGVTVQATQGGSPVGSGATDSDGYYRIANLASGSYTLVPSQAGYSFAPLFLSVAGVPATGNDFNARNSSSPPQAITLVTANPAVVPSSSATTTLSAVANGYGTLTYSWDAVGGSAPVSFSLNDSSDASSTTVSFQAPGNYTFRARVTDGNGLPATATVSVTVITGPGPMVVAPFQVQIGAGQAVAFRADAWDQLGNRTSVSPTWSAGGGGAIDSTGLFSATTPGGPYAVTATAGSLSATGYVWVAASAGSSNPPVITTTAANGVITLTWNSIPGTTYRVEYKNSLSDPAWNPLAPDVVASGPAAAETDPVGVGQRFYRVEVVQ